MRSTPLLAVAALAAIALPATADAAIRTTTYDVTFEATLTEAWKSATHWDHLCFVRDQEGRCTDDVVGDGTARVFLRTSTPKRVTVMSGGRMKPMIQYAIDSGIPLKGEYKRTGSLTDTHGGLWAAANPPWAAETAGCGSKAIKADVSLSWSGRNQLQPIMLLDEPTECPTGPQEGFDWSPGSPSFQDVVATVGETKFGRTKQFRFGGRQTWKGSITPITRTDPDDLYSKSGESEVTWTWEAVFRKVTPKKKRKRR